MAEETIDQCLERRRALERAYKKELELVDQEVIRMRASLIRLLNNLSGRDGPADVGEAISVILEAVDSSQRVIGRSVRTKSVATS
jgi:hypothetical protein